MGKIRSTLDIVMEKTRNVSMTRDDKENLRHKELAHQARAGVRKYLDAKMTLQDMGSELDASGDDRPVLLKLIKHDLLENIRIDGDNLRVLDALEKLYGINRARIVEHIQALRARLDSEMITRLAGIRSELEGKGIRGSAVIPNIAHDTAWRDTLAHAQKQLAGELGATL